MSEKLNSITLFEYDPMHLPGDALSEEAGKILWAEYKEQIDLEIPSFKTKGRWRLKSNGWVGHIPLTADQEIILLPKVPIKSIFSMLEYAYELKKFKFLDGETNYESIKEFYEILAIKLAKCVLDRGRKGFYREYRPHVERLSHIRGRINIRRMVARPWEIKPECYFKEHTSNIEENQIIAWTIYCILHSGLCTNRSLPLLHRAYQSLQGLAAIKPFNPENCIDRIYNRLNQDYEPIHAICRFFLENCGPTHNVGGHNMKPFLIDMASLYELFVSKWLEAHTYSFPAGYRIKAHDRVSLGRNKKVHLDIDLVLYNNSRACCVLDTKYKIPEKIKNPDIFQISYYARSKDCHDAVLIYPKKQNEPFDEPLKEIRVRFLSFPLDEDLDNAGEIFLDNLFETRICADESKSLHQRTENFADNR